MHEFLSLFSDIPSPPTLAVQVSNPRSLRLSLDLGSLLLPSHRLPLLACSVFYKQKYGNLHRVAMPGRYKGEVALRNLQCGRNYQVYSR